MKKRQYAPFGVGDPANQFWLHIGNYTMPFHTLKDAVQYARSYYGQTGTYIRSRDGRKVWKRSITGQETGEMNVHI